MRHAGEHPPRPACASAVLRKRAERGTKTCGQPRPVQRSTGRAHFQDVHLLLAARLQGCGQRGRSLLVQLSQEAVQVSKLQEAAQEAHDTLHCCQERCLLALHIRFAVPRSTRASEAKAYSIQAACACQQQPLEQPAAAETLQSPDMYEGKEICDDLKQEDYLDTVAANDDLQSGQQLLQVPDGCCVVLGRPAAVHEWHEAVHNDGVHGVQCLLGLRQRPFQRWPGRCMTLQPTIIQSP